MTDNQQDAVPLAVAAELLGLSTEAVRKRIQRGTLPGHKVNGAWFVNVAVLPSGRPDEPSSHPDSDDQTSGQDEAAVRTRVRTSGGATPVDLTPLVEMIDRLHGENQRLTEAATAWQFRARAAEERLAVLEAGPIASVNKSGDADAAQDANAGPLRDETREMAYETLSQAREAPQLASESLVRRWWRRMTRNE